MIEDKVVSHSYGEARGWFPRRCPAYSGTCHTTITKVQIEAIDKAGIRGIRVELESDGVTDPAAAAANLDAAMALIRDTRWQAFRVRRFIVSVSPNNTPSLALIARFGFARIGQQVDDVDGPEDIYLREVQPALHKS
jgi:RimJ/RimL family protein N-acetyltransferase